MKYQIHTSINASHLFIDVKFIYSSKAFFLTSNNAKITLRTFEAVRQCFWFMLINKSENSLNLLFSNTLCCADAHPIKKFMFSLFNFCSSYSLSITFSKPASSDTLSFCLCPLMLSSVESVLNFQF